MTDADEGLTATRDELLEYADRIEQTADEVLRPMAVDPAAVLAGRGYHDVPQDQLDQHKLENAQAWQGAMQFAGQLRKTVEGMGEGELGSPELRGQAEIVQRAAGLGGWLTNAQEMARDHAEQNRVWDDGREKTELENGTHPLQQEVRTAEATGVMVHQEYDPGMTVERIRIVPSDDLPKVEDPRGEIPLDPEPPTPTPAPSAVPEPAAPARQTTEEYYRSRADECRFEAEEAAARAEVAEDANERADLYRQATELEEDAEDFDSDADEEHARQEEAAAVRVQEQAHGEAQASYWNTRAEEHRDMAEGFDQQAAETKDQEEAQNLRVTAIDERNLAEACERNAVIYGGAPADAQTQADVQNDIDAVLDEEVAAFIANAEQAEANDEVDWAVVEESAGRPIPQEERNALEMDGLKAKSDALVNAAEHVESGHEWVKTEIEEAAADGEGVQERWDRQQADMDRWDAAQARVDEEAATSYDDEPWTVQAEQDRADSVSREVREANADVAETAGKGTLLMDDGLDWGAASSSAPGYDQAGREFGYDGQANPFGTSYADTGFPGTSAEPAPVVAAAVGSGSEETAGL